MRYDQTRLWATDAIMCELILCVYESTDVWMHECMNVWMWLERPYKLHMTSDLMEQDRACKIGGGLTAQYKHSANFSGVDIIVNKSGHRWYATWHTVAADAPWEASSLSIESLGEVAICKWAQSVLPLACFSSHSLFLLLRIPNFCVDYPFGFLVHREYILFCAPNFCMDRPFGFSIHRDAHFCLSRLFKFSA